MDAGLPRKTEIPYTIVRIIRCLSTLRSFGARSSKCPITILPTANTTLTMAISNQSDSVVHIANSDFDAFIFPFTMTITTSIIQVESNADFGLCLNSAGVSPVNFLKTVLKVVVELKPASKPTERIVRFLFFSSSNNRLASSTR